MCKLPILRTLIEISMLAVTAADMFHRRRHIQACEMRPRYWYYAQTLHQ